MDLPEGVVTFLFTDVVDSTVLWSRHGDAMAAVVESVDDCIGQAVADHEGAVFKTVGDAVCAVFVEPSSAVAAAVAAQDLLADAEWPAGIEPPRVRMGIHMGAAQRYRATDYLGSTVNRVARIADAAHGGQVLISEPTRHMIETENATRVVDLGLHQLKGFDRPDRLFQLTHPSLQADHPPLRTESIVTAGNLRAIRPPLIGRDVELAELSRAVAGHRLLTLVGPGGVGKTTVAEELAAGIEPAPRDGAWMTELAPLAASSSVVAPVAADLGIRLDDVGSAAESLVRTLRSRRSLIILDNAEHVIESVRELVSRVLSECPEISVLVTSREPLGISGERVWRLDPLSIEAGAVDLLVERIEAAGIALDATPETRSRLVDIARTVDGLPLALELAASRVGSLGLVDLIDKLNRQTALLRRPDQSESRHSGLSAAIGWSYELLSAEHQAVFRRLTVFADGWTLDAAEQVVACDACEVQVARSDVMDSLDRLCRASLVQTTMSDRGEIRYRMLEPLRQFGAEQLDVHEESVVTRRAHAAHYLDVAGRLGPGLEDGGVIAASAHVEAEAELANMRTAHRWGLDTGDVDLALGVPVATGRGATHHQIYEIYDWLNAALAMPDAPQSDRYMDALAIATEGAATRGNRIHQQELLDQLRALASRTTVSRRAAGILRVMELYEGSIALDELAKGPPDPDPMAESERQMILALGYLYQESDRPRAALHADKLHEVGIGLWAVTASYVDAEICMDDDPRLAKDLLELAIEQAGAARIDFVRGAARVSLATALTRLGEIDHAARTLRDLIFEWHLQGNWQNQWTALRNAVELAAAAGRTNEAVELLAAIDASPTNPPVFGEQATRLRDLARSADPVRTRPHTDDEIVTRCLALLDSIGTV